MTRSNADRQKRFRARQRRGLAIWQIEVREIELHDALVDSGLVAPDAAEAEFRAAAGRVLADFVSRYSVTRYGAWLAKHGKNGA